MSDNLTAVIRRHPIEGFTWILHNDWSATEAPKANTLMVSYPTPAAAAEAAYSVGIDITYPHSEIWSVACDEAFEDDADNVGYGCGCEDAPDEATPMKNVGYLTTLGVDTTPRRAALEEVADLIDGDRDKSYGSPKENFGRTAAMWQVLFPEREWKPADIARAMIAVKLARDVHSFKRDGFLDIAGYAACGVEVEGL